MSASIPSDLSPLEFVQVGVLSEVIASGVAETPTSPVVRAVALAIVAVAAARAAGICPDCLLAEVLDAAEDFLAEEGF